MVQDKLSTQEEWHLYYLWDVDHSFSEYWCRSNCKSPKVSKAEKVNNKYPINDSMLIKLVSLLKNILGYLKYSGRRTLEFLSQREPILTHCDTSGWLQVCYLIMLPLSVLCVKCRNWLMCKLVRTVHMFCVCHFILSLYLAYTKLSSKWQIIQVLSYKPTLLLLLLFWYFKCSLIAARLKYLKYFTCYIKDE